MSLLGLVGSKGNELSFLMLNISGCWKLHVRFGRVVS